MKHFIGGAALGALVVVIVDIYVTVRRSERPVFADALAMACLGGIAAWGLL